EEAGNYLDEHLADLERSTTQSLLDVMERQTLRGIVSPQTLMTLVAGLEDVRRQGDLLALRGLLALEQGDNPTAARCFRKADELTNQGQFFFEGAILARRYLQLLQANRGDN